MTTNAKILMVDDEPNVLSGYRRTVGRKHQLTTVEGGRAGLKALDDQGPFSVVVTDMRMPEMDGLAFLCEARVKHPDCVYAMLTGNADQQTAIDAINKGQIFRFLNKPCDPETLDATIAACLRQHELMQAERVLLRQTLTGTVRLLTEAIVLADPNLGNAMTTIRRDVQAIAQAIGAGNDWRISIAASLSLLGSLVAPDNREKADLTDEFLASCAEAGANLLRYIPRMEEISQIIAKQREVGRLPGRLEPEDAAGRIEIGSKLLRFVVDWYRETSRANGDRGRALERLSQNAANYDARVLATAEKFIAVAEAAPRAAVLKRIQCEVKDVHSGMILDQDINTLDGKMLLSKGQVLSQLQAERLKSFARSGLIAEKAEVLVESREAA